MYKRQDGISTLKNTTQSTNKDNGALVIEGGVGVEKNINIGGNSSVTGNSVVGGNSTVTGITGLNGQVTINAGVVGGDANYDAYPLRAVSYTHLDVYKRQVWRGCHL